MTIEEIRYAINNSGLTIDELRELAEECNNYADELELDEQIHQGEEDAK